MKAFVLRATGGEGLEHTALDDVPPAAAPGPGEVRVAIKAAALNHLDLFVIRGLPGLPKTLPHILGSDGAGVVESVGAGVTAVRPGERVLINPGISDYSCEFCLKGEQSLCVRYGILGEHLPGTMAELATVPVHNVLPVPETTPPITWAEAAAFSLVTLTAWRMVVTRAQLQAGEWVLVWGIGGGVSLAALRIARLVGARVIATSSSDAKLMRARELGAEVMVNHRTQQVPQVVRELTGKRGVDVVVENVGEATWGDSLRCLAKGGRIVTCGGTTGPKLVTDVRPLFWHQFTILGSTMGNAAEYREVVRRLGQGELRPIVDATFPLSRARDGFERLQRGDQIGKVVVEIGS
ncbi:MAG TPA: zinc-binding dehydrogenase [Gemmatimonadales bacterium]|nr:zinc-binding dehydrogenase [Gemmatimonadales bacterium]